MLVNAGILRLETASLITLPEMKTNKSSKHLSDDEKKRLLGFSYWLGGEEKQWVSHNLTDREVFVSCSTEKVKTNLQQ